MAVSEGISVEQSCQRGQNRISPIRDGSVMEVCRPEDNGGNNQAIGACRPSLNAVAQKILKNPPEKEFLRNGNCEVDAKELER